MDAPDTIYVSAWSARTGWGAFGSKPDEGDIPYHRERSCVWSHNGCDVWETSCAQAFEFIDDGPKENSFKYCPFCGGTIEIKEAENG